MEEIKKLCWFYIDGKTILLISDNWKGTPMIAAKADYVIMSEYVYKKYIDCIIGEAKKNKFLFLS